jgi:hypothetical protein
MSDAPFHVIIQTEPEWKDLVRNLQSQAVKVRPEEHESLDLLDDQYFIRKVLGSNYEPEGSRGPKDWKPSSLRFVAVGNSGVEILAMQVSQLPGYISLREKAVDLMVANALIPEYFDVSASFDRASSAVTDMFKPDRELWGKDDPSGFIVDSLFAYLNIHKNDNGWYEVLWFPWNAGVVTRRLRPFSHRPEPGKEIRRLEVLMGREFSRLFGMLMAVFFRTLTRQMHSINPMERLRGFLGYFDRVCKDHPDSVKAAKREMFQLLTGEKFP